MFIGGDIDSYDYMVIKLKIKLNAFDISKLNINDIRRWYQLDYLDWYAVLNAETEIDKYWSKFKDITIETAGDRKGRKYNVVKK